MYHDDFYMGQAAGRRLSRGSTGQRAGTAMRVMKPASANNSPRAAILAARRRTMMYESSNNRRQQQVLDYLNPAQTQNPFVPRQDAMLSQGRPVSWHPSTHLLALPSNFAHTPNTNPLSTPNMYSDYQDLYFGAGPHYSPMVESYSTNTSPASTFSPLPAAFPPLENDQYFGTEGWEMPQKPAAMYTPNEESQMFPNSLPSSMESGQVQGGNIQWNNFIMHGFNRTSPPTPEAFLQPPQQQQPPTQGRPAAFPQVEPAEEEGEILVGMGLYDTPDKHQEDPQLNNYHSTVTSLLGSTFRYPEPVGKGLKLEETWEPPKSDDESEDEDDELDAEGEEEAAGTA
ncbi:hypothetical protein ISF_03949 [Cordyceps fumosorosea ARSEF 2679]|uniref:Uncharacterized protein n=1 Tax=Cordyceps fumosorosea (strain ARSEF 2679) TaxID=1081104 RepID=A0A167YBD2_CORFA|nr:hypothetical protein ISF_03949 [Cordyceps fumosorosea ARSEF 2679]OAA66111.1 hypothetical protein ISF_03949 [Cordyceps fumosorosea ARSEF 2679]